MNMLKWNINISSNMPRGSDAVDQFITPVRRMRIKKPDPEITLNTVDFPE